MDEPFVAEQVVGAAGFPVGARRDTYQPFFSKILPKTVRVKTTKHAFSAVLSFSWVDAALRSVLRKLTTVQHPQHYFQVGSFILFISAKPLGLFL